MLHEYVPIPTLAVTDLGRAREYYEGVLGFAPGPDTAGGVMYAAGGSSFLVYPSSYAGTNKATAMSFQIPADAFDAEVAALRERGVEFQTFDAEGLTWDDGVATFDGTRSAWFEDPDGNILNVETGS